MQPTEQLIRLKPLVPVHQSNLTHSYIDIFCCISIYPHIYISIYLYIYISIYRNLALTWYARQLCARHQKHVSRQKKFTTYCECIPIILRHLQTTKKRKNCIPIFLRRGRLQDIAEDSINRENTGNKILNHKGIELSRWRNSRRLLGYFGHWHFDVFCPQSMG